MIALRIDMAGNVRKESGSKFVRYFGPVLDALRDLGGSGAPNEVVRRVGANLQLSEQEQLEMVPSGSVTRLRDQVSWARFYLVHEGLVESPRRGEWRLTERGRTTRLTHDQARYIHATWKEFFQQQRRAGIFRRRKAAASSTRLVAS